MGLEESDRDKHQDEQGQKIEAKLSAIIYFQLNMKAD